ncbi:COQ9-domain-containing protein [Yarrowia lipolytica]|jgi:ubiquinone biosynthesis protein COQ9|uniref:Ubiquinone biosynthesis protein n=1 Tax=Yarrowia lipolytica TaxID=4952 RepID=A0A371CBF0_YARLL|nr:Ubiquinone biosynthesis protein COQ9 [Yarrowia lipolytica]RDW27621.1 COQ9-domain-containing protein [Yarrowia lipolytica]RDW31614.1 COQ9-domain-containing protein [Yarrowia lipolytica]RDW37075.1 COQ9-domain-containing protein [Yarrowia lipolytica]RDW44270.1 COQ9-domain-containing protein [Yarrowia lipolytica]
MFRTVRSCAVALPTRASTLRAYHSINLINTKPTEDYNPKTKKLLDAAMDLVPSLGFTDQALTLASRRLGYTDTTPLVLPKGPLDLIVYHLRREREKLAVASETAPADPPAAPTTPDFRTKDQRLDDACHELIVQRLKGNIPVIEHLDNALALMVQPQNMAESLSELGALSDEIVHQAGHRSSDFDWYTRRASISAVYAASEVYMCQDKSKNFEDTWKFVKSSLEARRGLQEGVGNVGQWVSFQGIASVMVIRSLMTRL